MNTLQHGVGYQLQAHLWVLSVLLWHKSKNI